jgi:hypothetical protein
MYSFRTNLVWIYPDGTKKLLIKLLVSLSTDHWYRFKQTPKIQGFMAVATAYIHPSLVEKIVPLQENTVLDKNSKKISYA